MNQTKEYILQTSLLLFLQKSFRDVTMKELVEKTGLSKGAFYHHFKSKEALFKEVVHMLFAMGNQNYETYPNDSILKFYKQYLADNEKSFEQLNTLFSQADNGKVSFNFFFIMFEAMNKFPEFMQMEEDNYHKSLGYWSKVIEQSKKTGEIKSTSSSNEIADLFLFITDGAFIRYLNNSSFQGSFNNYLTQAFNTVYNNVKT